MTIAEAQMALERLAKWRSIFAGWQLGTRPKGDPECDAVRDHREVTMLMLAELNALTRLVCKKLYISPEEFTIAVGEEAEFLSKQYAEKKFCGMEATDHGIAFTDIEEARITMQGWKP